MKYGFSFIALLAAFPAFAEGARQLDAHEHGVGTLNIAIDGTTVSMELEAPGADIVGFEYAAEREADHAAIDAAIATLSAPLDLFIMPDAAGCTLVNAKAELENDHAPDDHEDHGDDEHDEHADADHDKHDDEEHDDHADEEHDEHEDEAAHAEFHAQYTLTCAQPDALNEITFAYFESFPSAREVEVQLITASGAQAFEVPRDTPVLDLGR